METVASDFSAWAGVVSSILRFMKIATAGDVDDYPQNVRGRGPWLSLPNKGHGGNLLPPWIDGGSGSV